MIGRTTVIHIGNRTRIREPRGCLSIGYVAPDGDGYIVRQVGTADRRVETRDQGIDVLCARISIGTGIGMATIGLDHHARG